MHQERSNWYNPGFAMQAAEEMAPMVGCLSIKENHPLKHLLSLLVLITCLLRGIATNATAPAGDSKPLEIGSARQLLIDGSFFAASDNIRLKANPARKSGRIILQKDKPWETLIVNWFNVMEDGRKYRMWYECHGADERESTEHLYFLCQAESMDGKNWTKPDLGIFSYKGSTNNNIIYRTFRPSGHARMLGIAMFKDPTAPPDSRIKAAYQGLYSVYPPRKVTGMVSADGTKWAYFLNDICDTPMDGQYSCFWDDRLKKYVLYGLDEEGQSVRRAESSDFADFPTTSLVTQVADAGLVDAAFYSPVVLKYPYAQSVYLMFVGIHKHGSTKMGTRLAVSRDGIKWTWPQADAPFIHQGKAGEFDSGTISLAHGLIKAGDELWQYYSGTLSRPKAGLDKMLRCPQTTYSRVVSRQDGFVSADTDARGGFFVTLPLLFEGDNLHLNVKVQPGGWVRAGLLDENGKEIKGRAARDSLPITGDHVDVQVKWKSGTDIAKRYGKPTRLRVEMKDASLYAFEVQRTIFVK